MTKLSSFLLLILLSRWSMAFNLAPPSGRKANVASAKAPAVATSDTSSVSPTILHYRDQVQVDERLQADLQGVASTSSRQERISSGIRQDVLQNIVASQSFMLTTSVLMTGMCLLLSGHDMSELGNIHWTEGSFRSLFDLSFLGWRCMSGFLAAIPIVYMGHQVEISDRRDMSRANFSTANMVMSLFGRRHHHEETQSPTDISNHPTLSQPETHMMEALVAATFVALFSGVCEEVVFRGLIPAAIHFQTHSIPAALVGQAAFFGLSHVSPDAQEAENRVVGTLQSVAALWYGMVYLLAGGDIVPAIVAHVLYDTHVFMETWMQINDQMDYTDKAVVQQYSDEEISAIRNLKKECTTLNADTLVYLRRFFYSFDKDHSGTLSRADTQRAVSYAFLHETTQPQQETVDYMFDKVISDRNAGLKLPEFVHLILSLRSKCL